MISVPPTPIIICRCSPRSGRYAPLRGGPAGRPGPRLRSGTGWQLSEQRSTLDTSIRGITPILAETQPLQNPGRSNLTHVPLTHLPLSQLSANSAWVVCAMITHSLLRAAALDPHQPAVHAAPISAAEPSTFQYAWPDHNDASYCPSQPTGPGRQVAGDLDRHHEPCSGVPLAP